MSKPVTITVCDSTRQSIVAEFVYFYSFIVFKCIAVGNFWFAQPCAPIKMSNSAGNCIELSYPGFACGCKTGYWWNGNACSPGAGTCVHVFAGITGLFGYSGDGGPASAALFKSPNGVAVDADGNVYIAGEASRTCRKTICSLAFVVIQDALMCIVSLYNELECCLMHS